MPNEGTLKRKINGKLFYTTENIINSYGADAVRLFILSDSPPEKDVQWSEQGMASSYKFIQKLWNLNSKILQEINKNHQDNNSNELDIYTNKFLKKITDNLEKFSYNKITNILETKGKVKIFDKINFLFSKLN